LPWAQFALGSSKLGSLNQRCGSVAKPWGITWNQHASFSTSSSVENTGHKTWRISEGSHFERNLLRFIGVTWGLKLNSKRTFLKAAPCFPSHPHFSTRKLRAPRANILLTLQNLLHGNLLISRPSSRTTPRKFQATSCFSRSTLSNVKRFEDIKEQNRNITGISRGTLILYLKIPTTTKYAKVSSNFCDALNVNAFSHEPESLDKVSSLYDFKSEEVYPSSEAADAPRISLIYEIIFERLKECYHYWAY